MLGTVTRLLQSVPGVAAVLDQAAITAAGLAHARTGDLVVLAEPDRWFTYYFWLDDSRAPDFARSVDIHRKPGYDPAELFLDPALRWPKATVAWTLAKKKAVTQHDLRQTLARLLSEPVVILGGLVTSTLLNLFVVPSLYLRFARAGEAAPVAVRHG